MSVCLVIIHVFFISVGFNHVLLARSFLTYGITIWHRKLSSKISENISHLTALHDLHRVLHHIHLSKTVTSDHVPDENDNLLMTGVWIAALKI